MEVIGDGVPKFKVPINRVVASIGNAHSPAIYSVVTENVVQISTY